MLTRRVRIQVAVFVVIAVLGITYTGFRYAGLGHLVGADGYRVTVELAEPGGIFPNAAVAYRGVTVGAVRELRLTDDGIAVDLHIDEGAPPIPEAAKAVITTRSAIGEQYVDLRPDRDTEPYLREGSVIAQRDTAIPLPVETVLLNLNRLVESVPNDSLRTVVEELGTATRGTGPVLRSIIESTDAFVRTADGHLPATLDLIEKSRTALRTQIDQADNLHTFAGGLRGLAGQLKKSDPDLRRILATGPATFAELDGVVRDSGPGLSRLLANLASTTTLVGERLDGVEQVLVGYPVLLGWMPTVLPGDGTAHLGLILNAFDPLPCTRGYEGIKLRPGSDTTTQPYDPNVHCAEPPGSSTSVRGAQNAPGGGR